LGEIKLLRLIPFVLFPDAPVTILGVEPVIKHCFGFRAFASLYRRKRSFEEFEDLFMEHLALFDFAEASN
jgi:hypothetical protein